MSGADSIRQALDALEQTLLDIERVANSKDIERRRELISQRRMLAERLAEVQQRANAPGSPFASEPEHEEFQRCFSKVRNAIALHQATWSVVLIDNAPAEYLESSRSASAALRTFIAWGRGALRPG